MTPQQARIIASVSTIVGAVGLSVVVGFWDWRVGGGLLFALMLIGGIASLRSPSG